MFLLTGQHLILSSLADSLGTRGAERMEGKGTMDTLSVQDSIERPSLLQAVTSWHDLSLSPFSSLQENLEVKLHGRARVVELVRGKHLGMDHANVPDLEVAARGAHARLELA